MQNSIHMLLIRCFVLLLLAARCNFPSDAPAESDLSSTASSSSVAVEIQLADSLSLHGAPLAALGRYRTVATRLRDSIPLDNEGLGWIWVKIANTLIQSDQPAAASAQIDSIITRFPESRWATQALMARGSLHVSAGRYANALPDLIKSQKESDGEEAGRLALMIGYSYQQVNQWASAIEWYDRAATEYPLLADYALYYTAQCLQKLNREAEAIARLSRIGQAHPHSIFYGEAVKTTGEYYVRHNEAPRVLAEARTVLARVENANDRAAILLTKGRAHQAIGQPDSALHMYRIILTDYRETAYALDALNAFQDMKGGSESLSHHERLLSGLIYLTHRHYGMAKQDFIALVRSYTSSPATVDPAVAADAEYYLRQTQYLLKQYRYAEDGFSAFIEKYPNHEKASDAALYLARCIRERHGTMHSLSAYLAFAEKYPDHPTAPNAIMFVGQRYEGAGRYTQAAEYYLHLVAKYPEYNDAEAAHWSAGYNYYRSSQYAVASQVFRQLSVDRPRSEYAPKALFWSAKAAEKQNLTDTRALYEEVVSKYPESYFGYQARTALDRFSGQDRRSRLDGRPSDHIGDIAPISLDLIALKSRFERQGAGRDSINEGFRIDRARALFEAGLRHEGTEELQIVYYRNRDHLLALAEITHLYYQHRLYREGIRAAYRLQQKLIQTEGHDLAVTMMPFLYPTPFWMLVQEAASRFDLDPLFILAIIRQESRFDAGVKSWAGARGLMQLMPSTAKNLASQFRIRNYALDRLYEPEINILFGSRYISDQLKRFNDRPELALAAYNGGPSRVSRWIREHGARDIDEFVEHISIPETEDFVKAVMNNYAQYTYLLRENPVVQGAQ